MSRYIIAVIVAGLLAALGWRMWEQRYAEGYKAGVSELSAKVQAEAEKVTAARAALSAVKAEAAASAEASYQAEKAALKEKEDAEARIAAQQRTVARLRDSLAAAGGGALRPNPGDACGAEKLRAFDLDGILREGQRIAVEGGELLAETRSMVAECQAGARADAAMIRLAQRWAEAVQVDR